MDYEVSFRRYRLVYECSVKGYRIEIWSRYPGGSTLECCCDTSNDAIALSVDAWDGGNIPLRIKDGQYVTDRSEDKCVEISTKRELTKYISRVTKKVEKRRELGEKSVSVGKSFVRFLRSHVTVFNDDVRVCPESVEIRFLGGYGAWSGSDEDICDADTMDTKLYKYITGTLLKEFNSKYSDFNVSLSEIGEKAWTYFSVTPVGY